MLAGDQQRLQSCIHPPPRAVGIQAGGITDTTFQVYNSPSCRYGCAHPSQVSVLHGAVGTEPLRAAALCTMQWGRGFPTRHLAAPGAPPLATAGSAPNQGVKLLHFCSSNDLHFEISHFTSKILHLLLGWTVPPGPGRAIQKPSGAAGTGCFLQCWRLLSPTSHSQWIQRKGPHGCWKGWLQTSQRSGLRTAGFPAPAPLHERRHKPTPREFHLVPDTLDSISTTTTRLHTDLYTALGTGPLWKPLLRPQALDVMSASQFMAPL